MPNLLRGARTNKLCNMNLTNQEKIAVLTKLFENSPEAFGEFFFGSHLTKETPQFHRDIYSLLKDDGKKFIALGAPRGHAKTTITDLVFLAWCIAYQKRKFILLISDTYSQASLFLDTLKGELEGNDKLKAFYGNLKSDKWSEGTIVSNGTMIMAIGAGMKVRGLKFQNKRPDLVICDDLENEEMVSSMERRKKLEHWFNGALIPSMDKDGRLVVIGTILHYDSMLAKLLGKNSYSDFYKKTYKAIQDDGTALWPEHLSLEELENLKRKYYADGMGFLFHAEYQNDPVSDDSRKFKIEKIKYYKDEDLENKQINHFIAIDRAYSLAKTADFTGIIVVAVDGENNWYVRLAERFKGLEGELIDKLFDLRDYFKPVKVGIEQKAYEYTLKPTLDSEMRRRNAFFSVEEFKDKQRDKNYRIEGLVPRFERGAIFFREDQLDLIDELIKFPKAVHDDLSDALAYVESIAFTPKGVKSAGFIKREVLKQFDFYKKKMTSKKSITGSRYLRT